MTNNQNHKIRQAQKTTPPKPKVLSPFSDDKLHDENTENACIGAVLTSPQRYHEISGIVADGQAFGKLKLRWIWEAMKYLVEHDMEIDTVTVSCRLRDLGQLEDIGGAAKLTQLIRETPTSVHAEVYARLVERFYIKRQVMLLGTDIKSLVSTSEDVSLEKILSRVSSKIDTAMESLSKRVIVTMADHGNDHLDKSEKARAAGEVLVPISSGIPGFDNLIEGFVPATYLIGARVHEGKTITLSSIALNGALSEKSVLFFNCADGDLSTVLATFYGMESGLSPTMIERRTWNSQQYSQYVESLQRMSKLRLFIEHKNGVTPRDIWTKANIIQHVHGLDMIVIDYIQEMGVDDDVRIRNERERLIYISKALKDIRKKFNVPVIYGAQIRLDGDDDKQPRVENAQESRNIIQNADVGIALWHKDKHKKELVVSVQKNKKGNHQKGQTTLDFSSVTGRVGFKYQQPAPLTGQ